MAFENLENGIAQYRNFSSRAKYTRVYGCLVQYPSSVCRTVIIVSAGGGARSWIHDSPQFDIPNRFLTQFRHFVRSAEFLLLRPPPSENQQRRRSDGNYQKYESTDF